MKRGGGEEAPALSPALVRLAPSNGQSLGPRVPGTTGPGSPFFRSSALPSSSSPHQIPSCLASDMPNLCVTYCFAGRAGLWHLSLRLQVSGQGGIGRRHGQWVGVGVTQFHFRWVGLKCLRDSHEQKGLVSSRLCAETQGKPLKSWSHREVWGHPGVVYREEAEPETRP